MSKNKKPKSATAQLYASFPALIILSIVMVCVTFVYLNNSLGWFSSNKDTTATGMATRVQPMDAEAEFTVYIFDAKANDVRYTGDGRDDNEPRIGELDMQIHDVIFKSRNRYTPAIVHIRLTNIREDYRSDGTVTVTLNRNSDAAYIINNGRLMLPEKSTSILRFTLANNHGDPWLGSSPDPDIASSQTYQNIDGALYAKIVTNKDYADTATVNLDSKVFTTVSKTNGTVTEIQKAAAVVLEVNYTEAEVADGILDLFLYITYDEGLVGDFEHAAGIDTGSTTVGKITNLANDITALTVKLETL